MRRGGRCRHQEHAEYELVCNYNQQADARMARIDQVIVTVDVIDVYIIVVIPIGRPRFGVLEIIAAVIKAAISPRCTWK